MVELTKFVRRGKLSVAALALVLIVTLIRWASQTIQIWPAPSSAPRNSAPLHSVVRKRDHIAKPVNEKNNNNRSNQSNKKIHPRLTVFNRLHHALNYVYSPSLQAKYEDRRQCHHGVVGHVLQSRTCLNHSAIADHLLVNFGLDCGRSFWGSVLSGWLVKVKVKVGLLSLEKVRSDEL